MIRIFIGYHCIECGAHFAPTGRHPECPTCGCDDIWVEPEYIDVDDTVVPTIKASWRKDPEGTYRVYVKGEELPVGTQVRVEAKSGSVKYAVLTDMYSAVGEGYLYWYKEYTVREAIAR